MSERIFNTHDQLLAAVVAKTIKSSQAVAVSYHGGGGRGQFSRAVAWSPCFKTDPKSHWSDHGAKSFLHFGVTWRECVEQAKAWAGEKYGIGEWARNRTGDWVPAEVNRLHPIPKPPPADVIGTETERGL